MNLSPGGEDLSSIILASLFQLLHFDFQSAQKCVPGCGVTCECFSMGIYFTRYFLLRRLSGLCLKTDRSDFVFFVLLFVLHKCIVH